MKHYSIVFNIKSGSRRSFRISNPVTGLPKNEIEDAINQMIANDIFDQEHGFDSLARMELTSIERTLIL